jgi:hypoxanthine phosphoribosyltransferase
VGILKGSFVFMADLARELDPEIQPEFDFMAVSSYNGKKSSGQPKIEKDLNIDIKDRNVLVVEDIVDTGYSFETLLKILKARNPSTLKTCALLSKPDRREVDVPVDYKGFEIPDKWVEGFGLDTDQLNRNLPDIWHRKT